MDTKLKIFNAAVKLFSSKGYASVSVRDIADEVDIVVSSIYNHYQSKLDILKSLYDFYSIQLKGIQPSLDSLLKNIDSLSAYEILSKLDYHFDESISQTCEKILSIACRDFNTNEISAEFIQKVVFDPNKKLLAPLIQKMLELNKIEHLDIDTFVELVSLVVFAAAVKNHSPFHITLSSWQAAFSMLMSLIKPII